MQSLVRTIEALVRTFGLHSSVAQLYVHPNSAQAGPSAKQIYDRYDFDQSISIMQAAWCSEVLLVL